jgi:hypothetical protein
MIRKRFLLFPPREHTHLYLYPRLHPYFRQSQINFDEPDLSMFPDFAKAFAFEVNQIQYNHHKVFTLFFTLFVNF